MSDRARRRPPSSPVPSPSSTTRWYGLLGLDFRQFTRTIVLPQGDFAEFLTDDPGNRQKLLRRLLDIDVYARMGAIARERAAKAASQIEIYRSELVKLADATPERLAETEELVDRLTELEADVSTQLAELAEIDLELTERRTAVNRIDADLGATGGDRGSGRCW